jgi:tetratricopeptide (TPR) repeat protein
VGGDTDIAAAEAIKSDIAKVYTGYFVAAEQNEPQMASRDRATYADKIAAEFGYEPSRLIPEDNSNFEVCYHGVGSWAIIACTRYIEVRKWKSGPRDWTLALDLSERGFQYAAQDSYEPAIKDFSEAIKLAPGSVQYYIWRGQLYGMNGDYDSAIQDFTKAIELVPNYAAAYYNRGQTYAAKGSYDLAIKDFSAAIGFNQKYTLAYYMRGNVYYAKKTTPARSPIFPRRSVAAPMMRRHITAAGPLMPCKATTIMPSTIIPRPSVWSRPPWISISREPRSPRFGATTLWRSLILTRPFGSLRSAPNSICCAEMPGSERTTAGAPNATWTRRSRSIPTMMRASRLWHGT